MQDTAVLLDNAGGGDVVDINCEQHLAQPLVSGNVKHEGQHPGGIALVAAGGADVVADIAADLAERRCQGIAEPYGADDLVFFHSPIAGHSPFARHSACVVGCEQLEEGVAACQDHLVARFAVGSVFLCHVEEGAAPRGACLYEDQVVWHDRILYVYFDEMEFSPRVGWTGRGRGNDD